MTPPRTIPRLRPPRRVQAALLRESPWIAWVASLVAGLPNLYLLAAIAAVRYARVETSTQLVALVVFSFVAFAQATIPLVSFLLSPEATRKTANRLYAWLNAHYRPAVTAVATLAGVYMLITGVSNI